MASTPAGAAIETQRRPSSRSSLWMLGASVAFALMAAAVKLAAQHQVPLGQIVFYRCLLSVLVVSAYMSAMRLPFGTPNWRAHVQRGAAGFIGIIAYFGAIMLLPLAAAVTLNYTSPLLLATILLVLHRERPPPQMVLAMLAGFAGIVLLLQPSYEPSQWLGALAAFGSAITAAIAALNIRSLGRLEEPVARTVLYFSGIVTVASLPWYLMTDIRATTATGIACVIGVGVFATAGQVMLTLAYQRGQTLLTSLLGYSQVVFTSLIGVALWDDHPGPGAWLAMGLIIASGAVATLFMRSSADSTR
jgi:drug/metabolite transporter (DMT)-like permease